MKLSELQTICKNLAKLAPEDAEVVFRIDDTPIDLIGATMEGVTEVDMTRGNLKPAPRWDNKVVLDFAEMQGRV